MLVEYAERINPENLHRKALPVCGEIDRLFLHWTAGHYDDRYDDYHINITYDGNVYLTCESFTDAKCHTEFRNSRSIGITLDCAVDAVLRKALFPGDVDFGPEPPTELQIVSLCKVIAVLTDALGLEITSETVTTHAEIANVDGYGPINCNHNSIMRWDLWFIPHPDAKGKIILGGNYIRERSRWYRERFFRGLFQNNIF